MAGQGVVTRLARQRAGARVEQFLQPEGVHRQRGGAQVRGAGEHALARGVINRLLARSAGALPVDQPVERVVAERGRHAVVRPAGLLAPAVVARAAFGGTGRVDRIQAGQLVRMDAVAGEIRIIYL